MSRPECLAVVGTLGVGKTTVAQIISEEWGHDVYKERPEANPFLRGQYSDRARYAFQTQMWFLMDIYQQIQQAQNSSRNAVFDAWITQYAESYARAVLSKDELTIYTQLYDELTTRIDEPSLLIYLRADIPEIFNRCGRRNRDFEKNVKVEYLTTLDNFNREWIAASSLPKVIIETDGLDIVRSARARQQMLTAIDRARNTK